MCYWCIYYRERQREAETEKQREWDLYPVLPVDPMVILRYKLPQDVDGNLPPHKAAVTE